VNAPAGRPLSKPEIDLAQAIANRRLPNDVFPIADPDLAALSELLHRMAMCQEDTPATRMAHEAIGKLRAYLKKQGAM
jgi:hypothetical protein